MSEQTPETPVIEAVVIETETAPVEKKTFFTKKRIAIAAAATAAALTALYFKVKKSDSDETETDLWTTPVDESETATTENTSKK